MTAPKYVYIDLNHFIHLAKDVKHNGGHELNTLKQKVQNNELICPISADHFIEICAIGKVEQRQALFQIVADLNPQSIILKHSSEVRYLEVLERVAKFYKRTTDFNSVKELVFGQGFLRAFGEFNIDFSEWDNIDVEKSNEAQQILNFITGTPEILNYIAELYKGKIKDDGNEEFEKIKNAIAKDRISNAGKSYKNMLDECVLGLNREFIKLVMKALGHLGISEEEVKSNPPIEFWTKEYMAKIPTIATWSKLQVFLVRETSRPIKPNHIYDIAHLTTAISYCEFVICDKEMEEVIKRTGLDKEFGTKLFTSITDFLQNI